MTKHSTLQLQAGAIALLLSLPTGLQAQTWQWVSGQATGSTGNSRVYAAAVDAAGNTIVAGSFSGTITLGSTTLASAGGNDVFVARLNNAGAWTQAVRAGGPGDDVGVTVAVDGSGNAAVGGFYFGPTAGFGATTLTNANGNGDRSDAFVARLSSAGDWTQAVSIGGQNNDAATALALDGSGNIVVAGNFASTSVSFGPTTLTNANNNSSNDGFVARLNTAGVWSQAVRSGSPGDDFIRALVLNTNGNVIVAGDFAGATTTFGTINLTNTNTTQYSSDVYVARLGSDGVWTQAASGGGTGNDYGRALSADDVGNATVAGNMASVTATFGTTTLTNANNTGTTSDVFVARLSPANNWTQAIRGGGSGNDYTNAMAVDVNGSVSVTGSFDGATATFGAIELANASAAGTTSDIYVARANSAGTWNLALRAGGVSDDFSNALALDGGGNAVVGGDVASSPATFGTLTLASAGSGYAAKLMGLVTANKQSRAVAPFALAPNPAHGQVRLSWAEAKQAQQQPLLLLDGLGREVRRQQLPAQATQATLNLQGLSAGLYMVRLGSITQRLLVE